MWKSNWEETKQHFVDWWNRKGLVVGMWGAPCCEDAPHEDTHAPAEAPSVRELYLDAELRAQRNHHHLARRLFPADVLPIADTDIGPGSLALFLGSEPGFSPETVWFEPCIADCERPEVLPPLRFDEAWVEQKVAEINQVWFDVYQRVYDIIKLPDGSSAFGAFRLWGPGKTAKVQCDASAMFSPDMFRRFVVPSLTEQCRWLDNSQG